MILINRHRIHFNCNSSNTWRIHRTNGPAFITRERQSWCIHGTRHRIGGPAAICGDYTYYYIEGIEYNEPEYYDKIKEMGL